VKEQVLHLDPNDNYQSARDKIGWAQTARVLLVWPPSGRVLSRRIDLVLLQRHARGLGAQLALITNDPVVVERARDLGLPTFTSVESSSGRPWRGRARAPHEPQRRRPRPDLAELRSPANFGPTAWPAWLPWLAKGLVFIVALGGLLVLALAVVPGATVQVNPARHPVTTVVEVVADPALKSIQGNSVPARVVRAEVETTGQTATTGLTEVPSVPAAGSVVFTSLDGIVTVIPAGTGLRTTSGNQVRFRTLQTAPIAARLGATVVVGIQSLDLGPVGNVAAGQINAIDGPLGLELGVTNPGPTSGGARAQKASVSANDRTRLHDKLLAQLKGDALNAIQSQLGPSEFLAADSIAVANEVAQTYDRAVDEQADALQLTLRVAFTGLVIANSPAQQVAQAALAAQVPRGQSLVAGSETYVRETNLQTGADGLVRFSIDAKGIAVPIIVPDRVRELVLGQPIDESQFRLLSALSLNGAPTITVRPEWYPRLPWMSFRIDVVVTAGS
jgi:hypothetical protein